MNRFTNIIHSILNEADDISKAFDDAEAKKQNTSKPQNKEGEFSIASWSKANVHVLVDFFRYAHDNVDFSDNLDKVKQKLIDIFSNPLNGVINRTNFSTNKTVRVEVNNLKVHSFVANYYAKKINGYTSTKEIQKWVTNALMYFSNERRNSMKDRDKEQKSADQLDRAQSIKDIQRDEDEFLKKKYNDDIEKINASKSRTATAHITFREIEKTLKNYPKADQALDAAFSTLMKLSDMQYNDPKSVPYRFKINKEIIRDMIDVGYRVSDETKGSKVAVLNAIGSKQTKLSESKIS